MPDLKKSLPNHIEGLDELRGIAVLLVLIPHATYAAHIEIQGLGAIGVDLFFIISGYLISKILITSNKNQPGYFRNFYTRRAFRILPLVSLVILFGIVVSHIANRTYVNVLPFYLTFTQNFISPTTNLPMTDPTFVGPLVGCGPLWSLAVEEQFYLLLPLAIKYIKLEKLYILALLITILGILARTLIFEDKNYSLWYSNPQQTYFRMHYLGLGFLLACHNSKKIFLIVILLWIFCTLMAKPIKWAEPLVAIVLVYLVYRCITNKMMIENKFLAHIGKLCFGLYCLNWPIVALVDDVINTLPMVNFVIVVSATYVASLLSYRYFEQPILKLRHRFEI